VERRKPAAGRYREFYQFDADIVGTGSPLAVAEVVMMVCDVMKTLGLNAIVRVNNRRIFDTLVEKAVIRDKKKAKVLISLIDKVDKLGIEQVLREVNSDFGDKTRDLVFEFLNTEEETQESLTRIA